MEKEKNQHCKKLIRFEIDNADGQLDDIKVNDIISDFSVFTNNLHIKYSIPGERFKITIGKNILDAFF
ncbi:MAG: hypothetical protein M3Q58_15250 [Bacteroidota bacterium]|nr:hypothetical protein [Bacteroidota bacterium]